MKNRKHIIFYIITALLLAFSQEAFFNDLRMFDAKPNLTLVFLCICATRMDYMESIIYGAATGIFIDIVYGRYIGLYGLLYLYFALLIVFITKQTKFSDKIWWPIAVSPIPIMVYTVMESFFIRLLSLYAGEAQVLYKYGYGSHFIQRILPVTFYDILMIALLCMPVISFLRKKKGAFE